MRRRNGGGQLEWGRGGHGGLESACSGEDTTAAGVRTRAGALLKKRQSEGPCKALARTRRGTGPAILVPVGLCQTEQSGPCRTARFHLDLDRGGQAACGYLYR